MMSFFKDLKEFGKKCLNASVGFLAGFASPWYFIAVSIGTTASKAYKAAHKKAEGGFWGTLAGVLAGAGGAIVGGILGLVRAATEPNLWPGFSSITGAILAWNRGLKGFQEDCQSYAYEEFSFRDPPKDPKLTTAIELAPIKTESATLPNAHKKNKISVDSSSKQTLAKQIGATGVQTQPRRSLLTNYQIQTSPEKILNTTTAIPSEDFKAFQERSNTRYQDVKATQDLKSNNIQFSSNNIQQLFASASEFATQFKAPAFSVSASNLAGIIGVLEQAKSMKSSSITINKISYRDDKGAVQTIAGQRAIDTFYQQNRSKNIEPPPRPPTVSEAPKNRKLQG